MPALHLVTDAAQVTTINKGIEDFSPPTSAGTPVNRLSGYRLAVGDSFIYGPQVSTNDRPVIVVGPPGSQNTAELPHEHVRDNVWKFTDEYSFGGNNYEGIMYLFIGPDEQTPGYYNYWGVWMRRDKATDTWDRVWPFKRYYNNDAGYNQHGTAALPQISGRASYTGKASGLYTKDAANAGYFNADTTLSVIFNDSSVDAAERYSFTGTIDNFDLSGNEDASAWTVALSGSWPRDSSGLTLVRAYGTATGTGADGQVFDVVAYGTTPTGGTALQPSNVIGGEFKAYFTDGSAIGVFYTERDN